MTPKDAGVLLNVIGFITGGALYAMLLIMVLRSLGRTRDAKSNIDQTRLFFSGDLLSLGTAILGLFWNAGGLAVYGLRDLGARELPSTLTAAAFTALGFLPAVVVHSALRTREAFRTPNVLWLVIASYCISLIASVLHFYSAIADQAAPSRRAMLLLTISFGSLIVPLLYLTRKQTDRLRLLWIVALSFFAVSALHLSHHEGDQYSWPVELIGHHSSLPLALAILYQDFRFALADIFLKRALSLVALVALAFGLYTGIASRLLTRGQTGEFEPLAVGAVLGLWVATALAYPFLQKSVGSFVDRIVLRRPDYDAVRAGITALVSAEEDPAVIMDNVCDCLAPALSSHETGWAIWDEFKGSITTTNQALRADLESTLPERLDPESISIVITGLRSNGAIVIAPTAEPPRYVIVIRELYGGRRLMSDDLAMLESVSFIVARRIDALRINHERCEQSLREQEIGKLATEAELRALRAQINPHFLFNALTTLGYLIQTAPDRALSTLMRLTDLLRRLLRSGGEFVTLGEEIGLIECYLEIEHARFEERLTTSIDIPRNLSSLRIPPLLIQPLVENAIKHGIAPTRLGGEVVITASVEVEQTEASESKSLLCITVQDTGAGVSEIQLAQGRKRGLGLNNVEQRLKSYYGSGARLAIRSIPGSGTTVEAWLPVSELEETNAISERRRA
jgi:two-component system, LytTR family, sensor kinase